MSTTDITTKKAVNLSLNEALVQESRTYCGNLSAKVEEMLQAYVVSERQSRQHHRQQAQQDVQGQRPNAGVSSAGHGQLMADALDELLTRSWG